MPAAERPKLSHTARRRSQPKEQNMNESTTIETEARGHVGLQRLVSQPTEREKRQWWVIAEDHVQIVTGYSCAPTNPEMWWCPKVGCSMSEKYHLFETEGEAINKLIAELKRRIEVAADNIEALKRRLANIPS